ncbi:MFS transporter [Actinocorallia sp. API 0066]|uniref:MFS transporter n=1 Tax=Actinocorallia sp. API 0066 TaxID=2896846 RepID=UPI001E317CB0|nr:MFS transporter [Actinocorallia sp. API 0066]MCD0450052.1 MFS transporter [Actinocorallia sp. API 0066]
MVSPRMSVAAVFCLHGAVGGSFATRIPWIQEHVDTGPAGLGLALLAPALGAFLAMPLTGRLIHRRGARTVTRATAVLFAAALVPPSLAADLPVLWVLLFGYGVLGGVCDVAMNGLGVEVERELGRPIMSGLHGMWSVGALLGAGAGALAAAAHVDARTHFAAAAAVLVVVALLAARGLPDPPPGLAEPARFTLPGRELLGIGLVGFCAVFAEGATADWCAVYLRDVVDAGPGIAASSYTAFAVTMAVSRLLGDTLVARIGTVRMVRVSGALAVVGGVLVVTAASPLPAIAGFALIGLGIAVVVPLAFAAAGRAAAVPNEGVAAVATITYSCLLVSPALIGGLASVTSLPVSFAVITAMALLMTLSAGFLRPADARTA